MAKKIVSAVTTVLSWLLLIAMILSIAALLLTKISGGEPQIFGYRLFVIASGSMSPTLEVEDVILSKNYKEGDTLEVGDILTYRGSGETEGALVTHRLVAIQEKDGVEQLILRGDFNNVEDNPITESELVAKYVCKLTILGYIFKLMRSKLGIPVLLLMIMFFIVLESLDFYKDLKKHKAEEKLSDTETDKKKEKEEENE